jgi:hypothetical protein
VSGWSWPSLASRIASARSYKRRALARSPWSCRTLARLLKLQAVKGCSGPRRAS